MTRSILRYFNFKMLKITFRISELKIQCYSGSAVAKGKVFLKGHGYFLSLDIVVLLIKISDHAST